MKKQLDDALRRHGVEGEEAFYLLAYEYLARVEGRLTKSPALVVEKGGAAKRRVESDDRLFALVDRIISSDPEGEELPSWYQYFIGRRFREGSGKFFTPRPVARAMAALVPRLDGACIMDPACGAGTFLVEASRRWGRLKCRLVANDVEHSLVDLAEIVVGLAAPHHHGKSFTRSNIYEPDHLTRALRGRVDFILANPPFSLRLGPAEAESELFALGYRTSDALFLDVCLKLLKPGGRLVCLLPHSIVANAEYQPLRAAVEKRWDLLGVIGLPEGVFQQTASTTTRADILILEKKRPGSTTPARKALFAFAPSVGLPLNVRTPKGSTDCLNEIVNSPGVVKALGLK
jgi:SAM-dependent methyltransferase